MQGKLEKEEQKTLAEVAAALAERHVSYGTAPPITIDEAGGFLERVMGVLFPHYSGIPLADAEAVAAALSEVRESLLGFLGCATGDTGSKCDEIADAFIAMLPGIADAVRLDAEAILEGDPAAGSLAEIIMAYPGCYAVAAYRIAHPLRDWKIPFFPRLLSEYAHRVTGIDINPGATIGKSFFVDHGTAIVIGETALIGDYVKIYQGPSPAQPPPPSSGNGACRRWCRCARRPPGRPPRTRRRSCTPTAPPASRSRGPATARGRRPAPRRSPPAATGRGLPYTPWRPG